MNEFFKIKTKNGETWIMNVAFASGDLYSKLAIVTIKSLLMNNQSADSINIYYIEDRISAENKTALKELVDEYGREICFIPFPEELNSLSGSNRNGQTVFSYCYLQEILPEEVEKVLLLEPDTVITGSLEKLYNADISDYYIAAADDLQSKWYKKRLGMKDNQSYVNCGVILYNLKKWREDNLTMEITANLKSGTHMLFYDVQDVINYTVKGFVKVFPPRFNSTTAIFLFSYKNMLRYRRPSTYCTKKGFEEGRNHPVVVHFTKNQVIQSRPWVEYCSHPYKDYYLEIQKQTVMRDEPLWPYHSGILNRVGAFLYKNFPQAITASLLGIVHSFLYPIFLHRIMFKKR